MLEWFKTSTFFVSVRCSSLLVLPISLTRQYSINYTENVVFSCLRSHLNFKFLFLFYFLIKIWFQINQIRSKQIPCITFFRNLFGSLSLSPAADKYRKLILRITNFHEISTEFSLLWCLPSWLIQRKMHYTPNSTTQRQSQTSTEIFFWLKSFVNTNQNGKQIGVWARSRPLGSREGKFRAFVLITLHWKMSCNETCGGWCLLFLTFY